MATLYCLHCDYNLTGLRENRCPECGRPFDPDELARIARTLPKPTGVLLPLFWVLLLPSVSCLMWFLADGLVEEHAVKVFGPLALLAYAVVSLFIIDDLTKRIVFTLALRHGAGFGWRKRRLQIALVRLMLIFLILALTLFMPSLAAMAWKRL